MEDDGNTGSNIMRPFCLNPNKKEIRFMDFHIYLVSKKNLVEMTTFKILMKLNLQRSPIRTGGATVGRAINYAAPDH